MLGEKCGYSVVWHSVDTPRDFDISIVTCSRQFLSLCNLTNKMFGFGEVYSRVSLSFSDDVIAMRKNKFYFLVFVSLIIWAIATYYLFLHKPTSSHHKSEVRR